METVKTMQLRDDKAKIKKIIIITACDEVPMESCISCGVIIQCTDMKTTHEEADVIIVQQVIMAAETKTCITAVCADTDGFVLQSYYYLMQSFDCKIYMEEKRNVIDIAEIVAKHKCIVPELPAMHALTGHDTTSFFWGVGKPLL